MALLLPAVPLLARQLSSHLYAEAEVPPALLDDEKELRPQPSQIGQMLVQRLGGNTSSKKDAADNDDAATDEKSFPPPPQLARQISLHHISLLRSGLRQLMYFFIVGSTIRLAHAWWTYKEHGYVFPAGGVGDYLAQANPQQLLVVVHVAFATVWTAMLFYQFYTGLRDRRKQPTSHAYIGYLATGFAGVAALSGWSAVWTLGVPSFVTPFIKAQLFIGAPGFFTEAVNGILAITKKRDWRRHRKHMTLAVIGTVADAGNG